METIMLIAEKSDLLPVFKQKVEYAFPTAFISDLGNNQPGFVIELSSRSRIYIEFYGNDLESIGWEGFEVELITNRFPLSHYVYGISYHSLETVKRVIVILANSDQMLVDNDFGTLLVGSDFVQKIHAEPNWIWWDNLSQE
jgi:hypothetical protein